MLKYPDGGEPFPLRNSRVVFACATTVTYTIAFDVFVFGLLYNLVIYKKAQIEVLTPEITPQRS